MKHEHESLPGEEAPHLAATPALSDRDICDSYLYLLGRLLALRHEHFDFLGGARWNEIVHRDLDNTTNHAHLEVARSDAWIAVDESSCTLIDVPKITGRYYTAQVINPWGETVVNINDRTFPGHPYGPFALCLKGARCLVPGGARRIDLPCRKARVIVRIEIGANPKDAVALQRRFTIRATGAPAIASAVAMPLFPDERLPGVEVFDTALAVLASEMDVNLGMEAIQAKVRAIAALARNRGARGRIDRVVRDRAWGLKPVLYMTEHDWVTSRLAGSFGPDWLSRTASNLFEMWSNYKTEATVFRTGTVGRLDGSSTYTMTFSKNDLPWARVRYFWSLACHDARTRRVVPNALRRYVLTSHANTQLDSDGALRLYFAPNLPDGAPEQNWVPTPAGQPYILTWTSYGPDGATISGQWYPPPIHRVDGTL